MYNNLFDNLEIMVSIFAVSSLSAYIFFTYYEFKFKKNLEDMRFIDNIIAFSILWIFECLIIVVYDFSINVSDDKELIYIVYFLFFIILTSIGLAFLTFVKRKKVQLIPLIPVSIISSMLVIAAIVIKISIHIIFDISLCTYVSVCVLFAIKTMRNCEKVTSIGFIYTICGVILIIAVNILEGLWGPGFALTMNLCISILLTVGFFIYCLEVYSFNVYKNVKKIEEKNKELIFTKQKIEHLAYIDQVTGLKNILRLQKDIKNLDKCKKYFLILHLKNFKTFSNSIGYEEGNKILLNISRKLKENIDDMNEIYHFYSDTFIIIHPGNKESSIGLVEKILKLFHENIFFTESLTPYFGITDMYENKKTFDCIIQELELTSQYARKESLDFAFYSEQIYLDFKNRLDIETDLRNAVKNKEWQIYFQPKISVLDNSIFGAEALIRWENPKNKVSPQVFIPLSEQMGLINDIGEYVLNKTFEYMSGVNELIFKNLNISINLSPYQLIEKNFTKYISNLLKKYKVNPRQITFEITESVLMKNLNSVNETIMNLREMGFKFSLDDFGTGYSSLNYFSKLNLDEVKFDRTFTKSIPYDEKNMIILDNLTKMLKKLGVHIVIEGIETKEQYECIKKIDCHAYQGYYYSKPVPYDDFINLIVNKKCINT